MNSQRTILYTCLSLLVLIMSCPCHSMSTGWALPASTLNPGWTAVVGTLSMAMDGNGNAIATWQAVDPAGAVYVAAAHYQANGNIWDPTVYTIRSGISNVSGAPVMHINEQGDAFIMWREGNAAPYSIYATKFDHGTPWSSWTYPIRTLSLNQCSLPLMQLATNDAGDALFIFGDAITYVSTWYDHGITWGTWTPTIITTPLTIYATGTIDLSLDNNSNAFAAVIASTNSYLYGAAYDAGSSLWTPAQKINGGTSEVSHKSLVAEQLSGKAYLSWIENNTLVRATYYNPLSPWPSFTMQTLENTGVLLAGSLQSCIDSIGHVTFMWTVHNGASTSGKLHTTYFNNTFWNLWIPTVVELDSSSVAPISQWALNVQPTSPHTVHALWEVAPTSTTDWYVRSNQATAGAWGGIPQKVYALDDSHAQDQLIHVDGTGNALATWGQVTGNTGTKTSVINAVWYDSTTALWHDHATPLSNASYCNCTDE